jgi:deazaflavin-dependent oxidoreductase (nitroreductase family)
MAHVKETARRWLYRGKRPNRFAALADRGTVAAAAAGIGPKRLAALEVRGRRTGRRLSLPVVVTEYEDERYLVAMLGSEANWVRNVRADGGAAVLRHGRRERVCLEELEPGERAPILQRYLQVAPGARAHFPVDRHAALPQFQAIAGDYPVFRICAARATAGEEAES